MESAGVRERLKLGMGNEDGGAIEWEGARKVEVEVG
jgi:hypothetical protein